MEQRAQMGPYIAAGCVALALGVAAFGFVLSNAVREAGRSIGNGAAIAGGNVSGGLQAGRQGSPPPESPRYVFMEAPSSIVDGLGDAGYWRVDRESGAMELFVYTRAEGGWVEVEQVQIVRVLPN